ncbi:hypothetical protein MTO96_015836 [Rhipicephalus appendiculatus]
MSHCTREYTLNNKRRCRAQDRDDVFQRLRVVTSAADSSQQQQQGALSDPKGAAASPASRDANEPSPLACFLSLCGSACDRADFVPVQRVSSRRLPPNGAGTRSLPPSALASISSSCREFGVAGGPAEIVYRCCCPVSACLGERVEHPAVTPPRMSLGRPPLSASGVPYFAFHPFPFLSLVLQRGTEARADARRRVTRAHPGVSHFAEQIAQPGRGGCVRVAGTSAALASRGSRGGRFSSCDKREKRCGPHTAGVRYGASLHIEFACLQATRGTHHTRLHSTQERLGDWRRVGPPIADEEQKALGEYGHFALT